MPAPACNDNWTDRRRYQCEVIRLLECLIASQAAGELIQKQTLCDDVNGDGSLIVPFFRFVTIDPNTCDTTIICDIAFDLSGPYTILGNVIECTIDSEIVNQEVLCYEQAVPSVTAYSGDPGTFAAPDTNVIRSIGFNGCTANPSTPLVGFPPPAENLEVTLDGQFMYVASGESDVTPPGYPDILLAKYNINDFTAPIYTVPLTGFVFGDPPTTERLRSLEYHPRTGELWGMTQNSATLDLTFYTIDEATGVLTHQFGGDTTIGGFPNSNLIGMAITDDGRFHIKSAGGEVRVIEDDYVTLTLEFIKGDAIRGFTSVFGNRLMLLGTVSDDVRETDGTVVDTCPPFIAIPFSSGLGVTPQQTTITKFIRCYFKQPDGTIVTQDQDLDGNPITVPDGAIICECPVIIGNTCANPVPISECCAKPTGVTKCYPDPDAPPFTQTDTFVAGTFLQATPPEGATHMQVKCWGAGGGSGVGGGATTTGGGGGFIQGTFVAQPFAVIVGTGGGGLVGTPGAAGSPNGGAGGAVTGSANIGGGGGGGTGLIGISGDWLIQAGAGGGGGGGSPSSGNGGAAGGTTGTDGGPSVVGPGVGGQGGQPTISGIGGVIGFPLADGKDTTFGFFGHTGGVGGDEIVPGINGSGGGGGGGWTASGGGSGNEPTTPFDPAAGGGGSSGADPHATDVLNIAGGGTTGANQLDPQFVPGAGPIINGDGGVLADGGDGVLVINWFSETPPLRKAFQEASCNADGSTSYVWRDCETNAIVDAALITDCIQPHCLTDEVGVNAQVEIVVDNPGLDFTLSLPGIAPTDGSNVFVTLASTPGAASNGWGIPPAGPFPSNPGDYDDPTFLGFGTFPWDTTGPESYFIRGNVIYGLNKEFQCDFEIYVPQAEASGPTDYSLWYYRSLRDGIWRKFGVSGDTLTTDLECMTPASRTDTDNVNVCNLEPAFTAIVMCDEDPPGTFTSFIRKVYDVPGLVTGGVIDLELDGITPYEVSSESNVVPCTREVSSCNKAAVSHVVTTGISIAVPAGLKSVTIERLTGTVTVAGAFVLSSGNSRITFSATESDCVNASLPAITIAGGTWQWIALSNVE